MIARLLDGRLPPHAIVSTGSWRFSWLLGLSGALLPPASDVQDLRGLLEASSGRVKARRESTVYLVECSSRYRFGTSSELDPLYVLRDM